MERKDYIKLYSLAPLIISALYHAMRETEVPAYLFARITAELGLNPLTRYET